MHALIAASCTKYIRLLWYVLIRAIFSFNPAEEPLIGESSIVVVNDVRHELYPEFLQRTAPYFFTFDKPRRCYKWANIAFVQVRVAHTIVTQRTSDITYCTTRLNSLFVLPDLARDLVPPEWRTDHGLRKARCISFMHTLTSAGTWH